MTDSRTMISLAVAIRDLQERISWAQWHEQPCDHLEAQLAALVAQQARGERWYIPW